ncbi:MAG: hypothetical protein ABFS56_29085 [Pseudomonadota bacterium]
MTSAISSQGQTSLAPGANRDKIIPAFFKAKSIFEPVVRNQLRELRELCRQKLVRAWEVAKAKANSDKTISQSQKEEIQRLWNESWLGTDALFEYLSTTYQFKIQSWEDIPIEHFDDICNVLPDISEEITQSFKDAELRESELEILNREISMSEKVHRFVLDYVRQEGCKGVEELSSKQLDYLLESLKVDEQD